MGWAVEMGVLDEGLFGYLPPLDSLKSFPRWQDGGFPPLGGFSVGVS